MTHPSLPGAVPSTRPGAAATSGLGSEWSLLVFTLAATCLVAWFTARQILGRPFDPVPFFVVGALAMLASVVHLGRPLGAWRAMLNFRRSWVSREIVLFSAFFATACLVGFLRPPPPAVGWLAVVFGFAALFSVDMVYRIPGQAVPAFPHSAMTTLTAVFFVGLLVRDPLLAVVPAAVKSGLYLVRIARCRGLGWPLPVLRIGAGFALPLVVWVTLPDLDVLFLLAGPLAGEFLDRAQFYVELEFLEPWRQIDIDLQRLQPRAAAGSGHGGSP
jgi:hypothetical protein